jgi:hypothetical protein
MCQRIKRWKPVGFRAKANFASGPAANHLKRLTLTRPYVQNDAPGPKGFLLVQCGGSLRRVEDQIQRY